ncbi:MAG TPA: hypothetical protein VN040_08550 [Pseudosphingobacterium sp.]|nr:hypothetical protein [Pseudosphingobacterium sp.]
MAYQTTGTAMAPATKIRATRSFDINVKTCIIEASKILEYRFLCYGMSYYTQPAQAIPDTNRDGKYREI